jgi:hypothetical protein
MSDSCAIDQVLIVPNQQLNVLAHGGMVTYMSPALDPVLREIARRLWIGC